jgi:hypothetical protein
LHQIGLQMNSALSNLVPLATAGCRRLTQGRD